MTDSFSSSHTAGKPDQPAQARYLKNSVFGLLRYLAPTLVTLVSMSIVFRVLGPVEFSVFAMAVAIASLGQLAQLGAGPALIHDVSSLTSGSRQFKDHRVVLSNLSLAALCINLLATVVLLGAAWGLGQLEELFSLAGTAVSSSVSLVFLLAGASSGLQMIYSTTVMIFDGFELFRFGTVVSLIRGVAAALSDTAIVLTYGNVTALLVARVIIQCMILIVLVAVWAREFLDVRAVQPQAVLASMKRFVGFGYNLSIATSASLLFRRGLYFVLSALLGPTVTGIFSFANEIALRIHPILASSFEFIFPATARLRRDGNTQELVRLIVVSYRVVVLLIFPLIAGAMLLSPELISLASGDALAVNQHAIASLYLASLIIAYFAYGISSISHYVANGMGLPHWNRNYNLLLAGFGIGSVLVGATYLGPYGVVGMPITLSIGSLAYSLLVPIRLFNQRAHPIRGTLLGLIGMTSLILILWAGMLAFPHPLGVIVRLGLAALFPALVYLIAMLRHRREFEELVGLVKGLAGTTAEDATLAD